MLLEMAVATAMLVGDCDNCVWTFTGTSTVSQCGANGETWQERGLVCHQNKFERNIGTLSSGTANSTAPMPKCDDGETLVTFPGTNIPMCASSLKPAHK